MQTPQTPFNARGHAPSPLSRLDRLRSVAAPFGARAFRAGLGGRCTPRALTALLAVATSLAAKTRSKTAASPPQQRRLLPWEFPKLPWALRRFSTKNDEKTNTAFIMVKPHANTPEARSFVKATLEEHGVTILKEDEICGDTIDRHGLIDTHYGSMADKALRQEPGELVVQASAEEAFQAAFGLEWKEALAQGQVYNARGALKKLGCSAEELEEMWAPLQLGEGKVKLSSGCYCGKVAGLFVINAFYMVMRSMYTEEKASVHYYVVEWPADKISWMSFRRDLLGSTDPASAPEGSMRCHFFKNWKAMGLPRLPHTGENAVHASASPVEALVERVNWLQLKPDQDPFMQLMQRHGLSPPVDHWMTDPAQEYEGKRVSLFDIFEDCDTEECLSRVRRLTHNQETAFSA